MRLGFSFQGIQHLLRLSPNRSGFLPHLAVRQLIPLRHCFACPHWLPIVEHTIRVVDVLKVLEVAVELVGVVLVTMVVLTLVVVEGLVVLVEDVVETVEVVVPWIVVVVVDWPGITVTKT